MRRAFALATLTFLLFTVSQSAARGVDDPKIELAPATRVSAAPQGSTSARGAQALAGTATIASWNFDTQPDGWTVLDRTVQPVFFHISNFSSAPGYSALDGVKSLWCGADCASYVDACTYGSAPGYGNEWNQRFESNPFFISGPVTVKFQMKYDVEPSYDFVYLEYAGNDNVWHVQQSWTGSGTVNVTELIPGTYTTPLKIRFRVMSDAAFSNEDGLYPSGGAAIIDDISLEQNNVPFNTETFELEVPNSTATNDGVWTALAPPVFGNFAGNFLGNFVLQEDIAYTNNTRLKGFFSGSAYNYTCGGFPSQSVVPKGTFIQGLPRFIRNEVQSPAFSIAAYPGSEPIVLGFDWYADLPLDNLVVLYYGVRSKVAGNWNKWRYNSTTYYQPIKAWLTFGKNLRPLIDAGATDIQVAIGVRDMCEVWCGIVGTGNCHSHGPLIDNVRVTQANTAAGANVSVTPVDATTSTSPINVFFSNISTAGLTTLNTGNTGPGLPAHFLLGNSIYYNLVTTATLAPNGTITLFINYDESALTVPESTLRLLHWDRSLTPNQWVDITTSLNTTTNIITGQTTSLSPFVIGAGSVTAVGDRTPGTFGLDQNIPNPFNPTTSITYRVPAGGAHVTIAIFDAAGRLVRMLLDRQDPAGSHRAVWDGRDDAGTAASSGVYFYRMRAGSFVQARRMVLLK